MSFYESLSILFSSAAFITSLIALYRNEKKLIYVRRLVGEANKKLDHANKIGSHANLLTQEELRVKMAPDISVHPSYFNVAWNDSESNVVELELRNNALTEITVTIIEVRGDWQLKEKLTPRVVWIDKPYPIQLHLPDHERESVTSKLTKFKDREQYLFEEIIRSRLFRATLYVECIGRFNDHYIFNLEYNRAKNAFIGSPVPLAI